MSYGRLKMPLSLFQITMDAVRAAIDRAFLSPMQQLRQQLFGPATMDTSPDIPAQTTAAALQPIVKAEPARPSAALSAVAAVLDQLDAAADTAPLSDHDMAAKRDFLDDEKPTQLNASAAAEYMALTSGQLHVASRGPCYCNA